MGGQPMICMVKDCGAVAEFRAVFVLVAKRSKGTITRPSTLCVCVEHGTADRAHALLRHNPVARRWIEKLMREAGEKVMPNWQRSYAVWERFKFTESAN